jgi:hypothetical protein
MNVHSATCSCSVELYKLWYTLVDFLPNWDISRGFLYISLISQDTPHTVIFCGFFLFIVLRKDHRSCDVRGGITRVYAPSSELVPPTPSSGCECVYPLGSKGVGEPHSLAVEWVGGPNSDDWIEGPELCILCSLASVVELKEKGPLRGRLS